MRGAAVNIPNWLHPGEDAHVLDLASGVAAVFDGLGGHGHGDMASTVARDSITAQLPPADEGRWPLTAANVCRTALVAARGERREWSRMTCTLVLARVWPDGRCKVAWCGDSRAYLLRADWRLVPLTEDHDLLYDQVQKGFVTPGQSGRRSVGARRCRKLEWKRGAPPVDSERGRTRSAMRWCRSCRLGPSTTSPASLSEGDVLVLCTDGVHDNLTLSRMQAIAADEPRSNDAATSAGRRGAQRARAEDGHAHPDDITCVALAL